MSIDTKKGVPGVPLAALSAIQDQNTRQVLQAIVDGWHVRNGSSGSGSSRFITAAELGDLSGQVGGLRNLIDQQRQSGAVLTAAQISRVITDLEASVMESVLFKELGDRINLIDQNAIDGLKAEAIARQAAITTEATTRQTADTSLANQIFTVTAAVNTNAAAIQNEVTARVNGDNSLSQQISTQIATVNGNLSALQTQQTTTANNVAALSQSISTLQITVGQNTVALQEESTVRANTDNDIYAKYSVKIDNNGYVSGFGLMSTSNNSAPFSEFIVRADRFAIGSPTGPGITPTVPFIVLTTPDANGNQPGVYMRNAMIANAAIGTAQIDDLAVNTLKIAGEAVSIVRNYDWIWNIATSPDTSWTPIIPAGMGYPQWIIPIPSTVSSATVVFQVSSSIYPSDGARVALILGLFVDGTLFAETGLSVGGDAVLHGLTKSLNSVGPGNHVVELKFRQQSPWTNNKGYMTTVTNLVMHVALR